jgi:hypothetical protein
LGATALHILNSEANALSGSGSYVQVGTMMAEFPLDPQLAKMMVAAPEFKYVGNGVGWGVEGRDVFACLSAVRFIVVFPGFCPGSFVWLE